MFDLIDRFESLDTSRYLDRIRSDMTDEAANQLAHVLDYVFSYSHQPIIIPSIADLKLSDDGSSNPTASCRIPGTAIKLTAVLDRDTSNEDYYFSGNTVSTTHEMYDKI